MSSGRWFSCVRQEGDVPAATMTAGHEEALMREPILTNSIDTEPITDEV